MNGENEGKYSMEIISEYKTSLFSNRLPHKKMNFKRYMYKRRMEYGRMSGMGLVNDNLRFLPVLNDCENEYIPLDLIDIPRIYKMEKKEEDENVMDRIRYDTEMNFNNRESTREIKLRKMLEEKLKKLSSLNQYQNRK